MRVLEFGPVPIVKSVYPEQTMLVGTGVDRLGSGDSTQFDFSLARLGQIIDLQRAGSFDAIFVTRPSSQRNALGPAAIFRLLANRRIRQRGLPVVRIFGDRILRLATDVPIILFDPSDAPFMPKNSYWLWARAHTVYKRELPLDHWKLFMRTAHHDVPTPRFRRRPAYRALVEKVRPMSLGLSPAAERAIPKEIPAKTVDVFFAGNTEANSSVRDSGLLELATLHGRGWKIDVSERRFSVAEFYRRCGQARLAWSPAGLGHDTFRIYEAAACGAVPLISRPSIHQYAPFTDGHNAFIYDPEPGGLSRAIERALQRREVLDEMGRAARAHVLTHHGAKARVDYMLGAVSGRHQ